MSVPPDLDADLEALWRGSNLTAAQALVWLHQRRHSSLPGKHTAVLWTIPANIDPARFEASVQQVVNGCDAMRTVVEEQAGFPRQRVTPEVGVALEKVDLTAAADPAEAAREWAVQRAQTPFQLDHRLFDSALLKLGENRFAWFLNQHQIIADGWSALLIFRRVADAYQAAVEGPAGTLPAAPLFADYVTAERQFADAPKFPKTRQYWQTKLAAAPTPLELPGDGTAGGATQRAHLSRSIGAARSSRLREITTGPDFAGAFQNLGLFSLFTGLLLTCLFHRTGQPRIALGIPASGRASRKLEDTAGLCTHMVVEHFEIAPDESLLALTRKVRSEMVEVLRQQNFVVSTMPPRRLYDAVINFCHGKSGAFLGSPVETEFIDPGFQDDSQEKIAFQVRDYDATRDFVLDFDFRRDAFDEARQQEFIRHFFGVLDAFLDDPNQPVRELCPMPPESIRMRPDTSTSTTSSLEVTGPEAFPATAAHETPAEPRSRPYTAPRTPVEESLARHWREALSVEQVGIHDNFFDLGGRSRLAVQVFARIDEEFGVHLPITALLQRPTIAQLAELIGQGEAASFWPSLVEIQNGRRHAPLFCAHGLGGEILGFRNLAKHVSPDRPVYGLRARGLDGKQEPRNSIEDMAAAYIQEMKSVQPEGPYSVIGLSFGGFVAYEIARQLSEQGQSIRLLGVLDTRRALTPPLFLLNLLLLSFRDKIGFFQAAQKARAQSGALARQIGARAGADSRRQSIGAVRAGNVTASRRYRLKPYAGRLTYFRATGFIAPAVANRLNHPWDALCRGGVEVIDLPCDHWSVLHEPHVRLLAERLEGCLARPGTPH